MYTSAKPYFYGTGRRKKSVARVRLYPGTGVITLNKRDIDEYFGLETLKLIVRQPLNLTETLGKFDIVCRVADGIEGAAAVGEIDGDKAGRDRERAGNEVGSFEISKDEIEYNGDHGGEEPHEEVFCAADGIDVYLCAVSLIGIFKP